MTMTQSHVASRASACDTIFHRSIVEDVNTGAETLSTFLAAKEHKAQGSSQATMDLDYLDGPTIIPEVCQSLQICI
jgi:hypothetical protein